MTFRSLQGYLSVIFCMVLASTLSALTPVQRSTIQQLTKDIKEGKVSAEQARQRAQQLRIPEKQTNDFIVQQLVETAAEKGIVDILGSAAPTRTMPQAKPAIAPRPVPTPTQPQAPTPGIPTPQAPVQPTVKPEQDLTAPRQPLIDISEYQQTGETKTPAPTIRKEIQDLELELKGLYIHLTDKNFVIPEKKDAIETFILATPEMKAELLKFKNDASLNAKEKALVNTLLNIEQPKLEKAAAEAQKMLDAAQKPTVATKPIAMPLIDVYIEKTYSDADITKYTTDLKTFKVPGDVATANSPLEIKESIVLDLKGATERFDGVSAKNKPKAAHEILLPAYYRAKIFMNMLNQKKSHPDFQQALDDAQKALEKFLQLKLQGDLRIVDLIEEFETEINKGSRFTPTTTAQPQIGTTKSQPKPVAQPERDYYREEITKPDVESFTEAEEPWLGVSKIKR